MSKIRYRSRSGMAGPAVLALLGASALTARADVLSDNLQKTTTDTETAAGDTWLTASFGTGASAYDLEGVTLLLASTSPGEAELDLYTDGGLEPGSLLGSLTAPAGYSSGLAETTFAASGLTLAADSTYWAVLKAGSGAFDWAWTSDNTGAGVGFQHTWGESDDAGLTWFTYDVYPTQFRVTATPATANATPEPGAPALLAAGVALGTGIRLRRRRRSGA